VKHSQKSFDPILGDYAFFEAHSTEAARDLEAYAGHLQGFADTHSFIRMLDFGGGTGSFTSAFLRRAAWSPDHLFLTLVEPGEQARQEALKALRPFTTHPMAHFPALPENLDPGFDLILANHVLYYVSGLTRTIDRLLRNLLIITSLFDGGSFSLGRCCASVTEPRLCSFGAPRPREKSLSPKRELIISRFLSYRKPAGKWLIAMSGLENALVQCWAHGFF
jgi:hypothetical protein